MDVETLKRWQSIETVLERARLALPQPDSGVRADFDEAIAEYQEFLSHNELGLAFDSLKYAAGIVPSPGAVWKDLIRAAEFMNLEDELPKLEELFVAAAELLPGEGLAQ
jgi:hypothetical protein